MKSFVFLFIIFLACSLSLTAQSEKGQTFNIEANAEQDIAKAVSLAKIDNKNVLIQVGGNWCSWCRKLLGMFQTDSKLDSIIKANYEFVLVNYSKENKNAEIMKKLENPGRFGYPVLVVLDQQGRRIHTQDTGLLELDKGYDMKKLITFLNSWSVKAINN